MNDRIKIIDDFRGIAILIMVLFHFFYQENMWFSRYGEILNSSWLNFLRVTSEVLFIFISGTCTEFSKDNKKRSIICIYLGILITIITGVVKRDEIIAFGILHFIGCAIIIYEGVKIWITDYNIKLGLVIFSSLFIVSFYIYDNGLLYKYIYNNELLNYIRLKGIFNAMGVTSSTFISSDYFPIFPWIFLFFAGGFFGKWLKVTSCKFKKIGGRLKLLSIIGKHSLAIYIFHIPVILLIIFMIK